MDYLPYMRRVLDDDPLSEHSYLADHDAMAWAVAEIERLRTRLAATEDELERSRQEVADWERRARWRNPGPVEEHAD